MYYIAQLYAKGTVKYLQVNYDEKLYFSFSYNSSLEYQVSITHDCHMSREGACSLNNTTQSFKSLLRQQVNSYFEACASKDRTSPNKDKHQSLR